MMMMMMEMIMMISITKGKKLVEADFVRYMKKQRIISYQPAKY